MDGSRIRGYGEPWRWQLSQKKEQMAISSEGFDKHERPSYVSWPVWPCAGKYTTEGFYCIMSLLVGLLFELHWITLHYFACQVSFTGITEKMGFVVYFCVQPWRRFLTTSANLKTLLCGPETIWMKKAEYSLQYLLSNSLRTITHLRVDFGIAQHVRKYENLRLIYTPRNLHIERSLRPFEISASHIASSDNGFILTPFLFLIFSRYSTSRAKKQDLVIEMKRLHCMKIAMVYSKFSTFCFSGFT